jgi:uncharacterized protein YybS (DUF2232 family)
MRNLVLLSVATIAAGFLMPALPFAGIPMAGFALGWIAYRFGTRPSIAVALVASAVVAVLGPAAVGIDRLDALFVVVAMLAAGPAAAWALRRYSAYSVVAAGTLVAAGVYLVAPIGAQTLKDSLMLSRQMLDALVAGGSVADPAALKESVAALLAQMAATWPATVVYTIGPGMLLSVPLVSRVGRSLGVEVKRYPALADTDLSFHLVWLAIAGLALLAAVTFWSHAQGTAYAVGLNLLMIVRPALALQGLAVFAALYRRISVGRVMRIIGFVLLGLTEVLVPSVSVLGLVDLFLNLRKFPRAGAKAGTGTAP